MLVALLPTSCGWISWSVEVNNGRTFCSFCGQHTNIGQQESLLSDVISYYVRMGREPVRFSIYQVKVSYDRCIPHLPVTSQGSTEDLKRPTWVLDSTAMQRRLAKLFLFPNVGKAYKRRPGKGDYLPRTKQPKRTVEQFRSTAFDLVDTTMRPDEHYWHVCREMHRHTHPFSPGV